MKQFFDNKKGKYLVSYICRWRSDLRMNPPWIWFPVEVIVLTSLLNVVNRSFLQLFHRFCPFSVPKCICHTREWNSLTFASFLIFLHYFQKIITNYHLSIMFWIFTSFLITQRSNFMLFFSKHCYFSSKFISIMRDLLHSGIEGKILQSMQPIFAVDIFPSWC